MSVQELLKSPPDNWTNLIVQSLTTANLNPNSSALNIGGQIIAIDTQFDNPAFRFESVGTTGTTGSSILLLQDDSAFNHPNSAVLRLNAPNSLTTGTGTNFIQCTNAAISGTTAGTGTFPNQTVFNVTSDGRLTGYSFTQISEEDRKKNIEALDLDSRKLRGMKPSLYHYKHEPDSYRKRSGLMYEDLHSVCPNACVEDHNGKHIDLNGQIGVLCSLLKNLESRVSGLEERNFV